MQQRFDHGSRSFHVQLDPAIVEISDTAEKPVPRRHTCRKRSIADALHQATNENMRTNRVVCCWLSHLPCHDLLWTQNRCGAFMLNGYSHTSLEPSRVLQFCANKLGEEIPVH